MNHELRREGAPSGAAYRRWHGVALAVLAIAGYFLIAEHRAHLSGYLPFLLLLACPLLHAFMHGGHERGHGTATSRARGRMFRP